MLITSLASIRIIPCNLAIQVGRGHKQGGQEKTKDLETDIK